MRLRGRRAATTIVAAGALALLSCGVATSSAAAANTDFNILVGADKTGKVDLLAIGPYRARVDIYEIVAGRRQLTRTLSLDARYVRGGREYGYALLDSIAPWRCDRRTRAFVATATTTTGTVFQSEVSATRTPSCAKRLRLAAPRRARRGARIRATVGDSWKIGGTKPRLCLTAPGTRRASCRKLAIRAGRTKASRRLRLEVEGHWRLELRTKYQRTRRTIAVGVKTRGARGREKSVLLLGDSMMSQLVTPISDKLGSRVNSENLLNGGGRLTDASFDWYRAARRRLAKLKPAAAVMLVGGGDGFPLRVSGVIVECCSEAWINEYAKRVAAMMRTLRRGGRTRVVWVLYPAAENAESREIQLAVNTAATRVAPRVRGVVLADLNRVISPGFVYREYATYRGRPVKIRARDGVHFTLQGASIAASHIVRTIGPLH